MAGILNYFNMVIALLVVWLYARNALVCTKPYWKIYKLMTSLNFLIVAIIYLMFIVEIAVDPIIIKLNTTLIITLVVANGLLGRDKYGKRS